MVATSSIAARATRGVDLSISFTYTPPDGEEREGLEIRAALEAKGNLRVEASTVEFDIETGEITATWQESATAKLKFDTPYEARFVRVRDGDSRLFFVRKVQLQ